MNHILFVLFFFFNGILFVTAQVEEDFSDSALHKKWHFEAGDWIVENEVLRSNQRIANGRFGLSTPSTLVKNTVWELRLELLFNPSSLNYVDVYLASDKQDMAQVENGYFVRLGGAKDDICLYKKQNGSTTLLIDGADGYLNKSANTIDVRVLCSSGFQWQLAYRPGGDSPYITEPFAVDSTVPSSSWFGILVVQSTSSFFSKHLVDYIRVREIEQDMSPPKLRSAAVTEASTILLEFDEELDQDWVFEPASFTLKNQLENTIPLRSITKSSGCSFCYELKTEQPMIPHSDIVLSFEGATDGYGNKDTAVRHYTIHYHLPKTIGYREVIFTEMMADPDPAIGLPDKEYIELYNRSNETIDLRGFVLSDLTTRVTLPGFRFAPDTYLILCKLSDTNEFREFGPVLGLPVFPSLNNGSDVLSLYHPDGHVVDKVGYHSSWYRDTQKSGGGYSLELIDDTKRCSGGSNWAASEHASGGTPGARNSIYLIKKDIGSLQLVDVAVQNASQIKVTVDRPLDTLSLLPSSIRVGDGIGVQAITWHRDSLDRWGLTFSAPMTPSKTYAISIQGLKDCEGIVSSGLEFDIVLPEPASSGEVALNEVLFNPYPYCVDFVEIFNNSLKYIDLKGWRLANFKGDTVFSPKILFGKSTLLAPQSYLVVTTDKANILNTYPRAFSPAIKETKQLPTYGDEAGSVVLLDAHNKIVDRFDYDASMHSPFLSKREGISLEKISPALPSSEKQNWYSASKEAGYATPGYRNSQYMALGHLQEAIEIAPLLITPNGDGDKDLMVIRLLSDQLGSLRSVAVFDLMGRVMRRLEIGHYAYAESMLQWDGTDDASMPVSFGHYILWIEVLDKEGNVKQFKKKIAVGERF